MTDPISLQPPRERALGSADLAAASVPGLPAELAHDLARRLQFLSVLIAVVIALSALVNQLTGVVPPHPMRVGSHVAGLLLSAAVFAIVRWGRLGAARLLTLGLAYAVLVAAVTALATVPDTWFGGASSPLLWSPVAAWVLIFPVVVPAPSVLAAVAASAAAVTEPLAVLAFSAAGLGPVPPFGVFLRRLWPNALAVLVAVAVSSVIYRLGQRLAAARELGHYRLERRLAEGGMGEVWVARHRLLARPAAVKLIRPGAVSEVESEPGAVERLFTRFELEAQATAQLSSPHTIGVYDFGIAPDGAFYYVMELLDGLDAETLLRQDGPQPPERVVYLLRQACHSLHEAHARGLVHRDIKPTNLFLCRYAMDLDFVKVLDFGLVKSVAPAPQTLRSPTRAGFIVGTPWYMSPEQILAAPIDGRADLYALGCVAYELLSGKMVFDSMAPMVVVSAHLNDPPVPVAERARQSVPAGLDAVVMACLAKDPAGRPATALELSERLEALDLERLWTATRRAEWWERWAQKREAGGGNRDA